MDTIFANARLILPDAILHGQLSVSDGKITRISEGTEVPDGAIDCQGDYIAPGLVELHTDNLERHIEPRPRVEWPHYAAILAHDAELASTGITTVFDAMRVGSLVTGKHAEIKEYARALVSELLALRGKELLRISHLIHLRAEICSETLIEELDSFGVEDRVGLVSLMDHTPGQRQFRDVNKLRDYLCGKHGLTEEEFQANIAGQKDLHKRVGARHEAHAVAAAGRLGAKLASHDDTTAEQVEVSAGHGIRLAEFPTTLEAAQACRDNGIAVMMGAPNLIRGGSHSGNVAAKTLAEHDLLDIFSSDYIPSSLMAAAFELATLWDDLPRAFKTVTGAPAMAAGLTDRGALEPGLRADLIRIHAADGLHQLRETWCGGKRVC